MPDTLSRVLTVSCSPAMATCQVRRSDNRIPLITGAMVLAHSLRDVGITRPLVVFVTADRMSPESLDELKTIYDEVIPVARVVNKSPANLYLMNRPDLVDTFTKIVLWQQTQYSRLLYIDADIVALRSPEELFQTTSQCAASNAGAGSVFAAVPDIGWPDCFNSGVMLLQPNMGDYYALLALAERGISFDGADQGLLNMHFQNWHRLSFAFNCTPSGHYQYVPAFRHFQSSISLVHFIGPDKPWRSARQSSSGGNVYDELLGRWWATYDKHFRIVPDRDSRHQNSIRRFVYGEQMEVLEPQSEPEHVAVPEPEPVPPFEPDPEPEPVVEEIPFQEPVAEVPARRYSIDWDPSRQPPPQHSQPEAAELPLKTYFMSSDRKLFQAPVVSAPPYNLCYQIPSAESRKAPPKPIFPWEQRSRKPSRVFAEEPDPEPADEAGYLPLGNAWDDMPEIDQYVSSLPMQRKAKVHVLSDVPTPTSPTAPASLAALRHVSAPEPSTGTDGQPAQERRSSARVTDFPSEQEHPSLSVTPAPVRRPAFWSTERDVSGCLPAAEGVPDQDDWNPAARLAELAQLQEKLLHENHEPASPRLGTLASAEGSPNIPQRKMPNSSTIFTATQGSPSGKRSRQISNQSPSLEMSSGATAVPAAI